MPDATFGAYLKRKAYEWKGKELKRTGHEPSQNKFAKFLGVTNTNLSMWMNDVRTPHGAALDNIAEKLHDLEAYDAAGVPRKMPKNRRLYRLVDLLASTVEKLPEEEQDKIYEQIRAVIESKTEGDTRNTTTA